MPQSLVFRANSRVQIVADMVNACIITSTQTATITPTRGFDTLCAAV